MYTQSKIQQIAETISKKQQLFNKIERILEEYDVRFMTLNINGDKVILNNSYDYQSSTDYLKLSEALKYMSSTDFIQVYRENADSIIKFKIITE